MPGMQLAIFDVDGTLTDTNDVDLRCYVRALAEEFDIDATGLDWSHYTFVTDSGITDEILRERFGRAPSAQEIERLQRRLLALLHAAHAENPADFSEIPGAAAALRELGAHPEWTVCIATGCWRASALMKLGAARIDVEGIPAAFCEDGMSREEIVRAAVARSKELHRLEGFRRIVSIGDGVWDVQTAARMELGFLGVRLDGSAEPLRDRGATHVVQDFTDMPRVLRLLAAAGVPART